MTKGRPAISMPRAATSVQIRKRTLMSFLMAFSHGFKYFHGLEVAKVLHGFWQNDSSPLHGNQVTSPSLKDSKLDLLSSCHLQDALGMMCLTYDTTFTVVKGVGFFRFSVWRGVPFIFRFLYFPNVSLFSLGFPCFPFSFLCFPIGFPAFPIGFPGLSIGFLDKYPFIFLVFPLVFLHFPI